MSLLSSYLKNLWKKGSVYKIIGLVLFTAIFYVIVSFKSFGGKKNGKKKTKKRKRRKKRRIARSNGSHYRSLIIAPLT